MKSINRRQFLGQTALAAGAFALSGLPLRAAILAKQPLGFQTFPIRDKLAKDFAGTLKMMQQLGYQVVEMCSPAGYAQIGFGPLTKLSASEIKTIISDSGLTCPSSHFGFGEFKETLDERIEWSRQLGLKHMICSTFWLPKTATIKDYLDAADVLNKAAEKISAAGMQCGFHNHSFEFAQLEGQLIYDALLKQFDPKLVKMQFQTEVINLGYKASTYFTQYPGRFISAHLSDWTTEKKQVPIGKGVIDWKEFFDTAKAAGVETYFVEMDMDTFKDSASYIHKLLDA